MSGSGPAYPLKLATGKHYLVDQRGVPFFLVGDAAWSLIVGVTLADAKVYLDDRVSRGFNTVLVNLIEHEFAPNFPNNFANVAPFTTANDLRTPNEAYFAHADNVINAAAERDVNVLLCHTYHGVGGGSQGWFNAAVSPRTTGELTTWGEFVGNRYKNFKNIIWVNAGDMNSTNMAKTTAIATGINNVDSNHIHTAHPDEGDTAFTIYGGEAWYQLNLTYDYFDRNHYTIASMITEYGRSPVVPAFMVEGRYEGEAGTARQIRQQMWESVLGGGFGHVFGNNPIWGFFTNGTNGYSGSSDFWKNELGSTGALNMRRWRDFFTARTWWDLVPDTGDTFLTSGKGSDPTRASAALASGGAWGAIYIPTSRTVTVSLSGFSGKVRARWYDPTNGALSLASLVPLPNSGSFSVATPGNNATGDADWVLFFDLDFSGGRLSKWLPATGCPVRR